MPSRTRCGKKCLAELSFWTAKGMAVTLTLFTLHTDVPALLFSKKRLSKKGRRRKRGSEDRGGNITPSSETASIAWVGLYNPQSLEFALNERSQSTASLLRTHQHPRYLRSKSLRYRKCSNAEHRDSAPGWL